MAIGGRSNEVRPCVGGKVSAMVISGGQVSVGANVLKSGVAGSDAAAGAAKRNDVLTTPASFRQRTDLEMGSPAERAYWRKF